MSKLFYLFIYYLRASHSGEAGIVLIFSDVCLSVQAKLINCTCQRLI